MSRSASKLCDVLIIGASPAACVAAIRARSLGCVVGLVETVVAGGSAGGLAWMNPEGIKFSEKCGLKMVSPIAEPFKGLSLYSSNLRRHTRLDGNELSGVLVDLKAFHRALLATAVESELLHVRGPICELSCGEAGVRAKLAGDVEVSARIVLIDDGVYSPAAAMIRLSGAAQVPRMAMCLSATMKISATPPTLSVALGAGHGANIGVLARSGRTLHIALLLREPTSAAASQFEQFRSAAAEAGLIPGKERGAPAVIPSPAGIALDMDSHVGKRALLIGDAGGFVAAFNHDNLYPAMRSGWLAAETAHRALGAKLLQDELVGFENAWRTELADYLRMPNTDLSLLMPLVFNDSLQMSQRVARAFLLGEKI